MNCKGCGAALPPAVRKARQFCGDACKHVYYRRKAREQPKPDRNEWYSPPEIVEAARRVMEGIDLDPASCFEANEQIVKARHYFNKDDNGLRLPWQIHSDEEYKGRIWLNPPYNNLAPKFFLKFSEEYEAKRVSMACLLFGVHHLTTNWFQRVENFAAILCLPRGRLKFSGQFDKGNTPMHGSAILGVGVNPGRFRQEFGAFGMVLELHPRTTPAITPVPLRLVSSHD
jgi:DNA N-6-adenine-methyltransferase (Dam)